MTTASLDYIVKNYLLKKRISFTLVYAIYGLRC